MRYSYYILFVLFICSCQKASKPILPKEKIDVSAEFTFESAGILDSEINAGESIEAKGTIETSSQSVNELHMVLQHALYTKSYPIKISNGAFQLNIPADDNQFAGEVIAKIVHGNQVIEQSMFYIMPLQAIDKMQNFNGPKDLFASDDDASMNVSIPHDKFGNPLFPPSVVKYQSSFEGEIQKLENKPVENLVAYQITKAKTKKGKYLIGSNSSEGFSQEQELIIGSAMPKSFNIELLSFHPFADSRQFIQLKTTQLADKFGNTVADGTLINFTVEEDGALVGVYQSFTIGGIANVYIENPSKESAWNIQASLHDGIRSNKVPLNFSKNVNDFDLEWDQEKQTLSIGPVVGILGQFVPDGTEVMISATNKNLENYIYLEEGKYDYKLPFDWIEKKPKKLEVLIGGHQKTIDLE